MNWLRRKIRNWLDDSYPVAIEESPICRDDSLSMDTALNFKVLPCNGGTVVEIRTFDKKTHDNTYTTYVIPDDEVIADRLGEIVSMELLKR